MAVGYNLGVWTLVSLASMDIIHLSSVPDPGPETAPITGLAWQESSDNLQPYTYLWVLKSGIESIAMAFLFPLSFNQRKLDSVEDPCNKELEYVN